MTSKKSEFRDSGEKLLKALRNRYPNCSIVNEIKNIDYANQSVLMECRIYNNAGETERPLAIAYAGNSGNEDKSFDFVNMAQEMAVRRAIIYCGIDATNGSQKHNDYPEEQREKCQAKSENSTLTEMFDSATTTASMTTEKAMAYVIPTGENKGLTMQELAAKSPSDFQWYVENATGDLGKAAKIVEKSLK